MSTNRNLLESKLRLAFAQLPYLVRALTLVWNSTRGWTVAWLVLLAAQGLLPVATVYLTRALVDALVLALQAEASWITFRPLLLLVGLMALVLLLTEVLHSAENYVGTVQAELVRDHISGLIHRKSVAVDLAFYDTPEYHDHLYRAQYLALDRPLMLLESLGSLVQNAITLVAMMGVLIPYSVWLPVALVASGLPALFLAMQHQLRLHRWRLKTTESERRSWYYNWLMTDREVAAELRIFDLGKHFDGLYQTLRGGLRSERLQLAWDQSIAELAAAVTALLITGLTLAWMLWKAVQGALSLGDLALFYQAFHQSQRVMRAMLENLGQIYSSSLFLKDLFEFLTLQPQISEPAQPLSVPARLQEGIRFEQVTFRYPG
nr:hypothetical protein [Caldilineaceae bacterium]